MAYAKKYIEDQIVRVDPLPTMQELSDYYAQKYYQESDGKKTTYDNTYTPEELEYKKLESNMTLQGMKENLPSGKNISILDLGCGEGFLIKEGLAQGYAATGVDFSSFGVEKWNPDVADHCHFGDIYDFLNKSVANGEKFDACILRNVLEHVIDPAALLQQMAAVLNKDGIILVTVPNDYSDLQKLAMEKKYIDKEFWFAPPDHLHYFNTKNIIPFAEKNDFSVIDMFSSFPIDFFLFHTGSNYIADRTKGKEAHFARITLDLLMAEQGMDKFVNLYRAMAACGIGRDFTAVLKKEMTKIAILSDIHGNMDALNAVLDDVQKQGIKRLFVCGDITGYYYDTATVWQALSSQDAVMCHGNHETILQDWIKGDSAQRDNIMRRYGSSYKITCETMNPKELEALLSLAHPVPVTVDGIRFLIAHGAPWNEDTYLYPDMGEEDRNKLSEYSDRYDVVLMGHTHYQLAIKNDDFLVMNAGSVGQPRSGKEKGGSLKECRAQWALYNTADRSHMLMTSYYDPSRIFEQADRYDPHLPYLKTVLKRQEAAA